MRTILWIHVAAGVVSLGAGFVALFATKGTRIHRRLGSVFVYAMLTMGLSGALIAAITGVETSVIMGCLAAYLVFTGLTSVSRTATAPPWVGLAGAGLAFVLCVALWEIGIRGAQSAGGSVEGLPAPMALFFGTIALAAGLSDIRLARGVAPSAAGRLTRHFWRMCLALFIASASFFLGQTQVIPMQLRTPWVLAPPVLAPLLVMGYWFWRTRVRRLLARSMASGDAA